MTRPANSASGERSNNSFDLWTSRYSRLKTILFCQPTAWVDGKP
jgi:hypothetical protein